MEQITVTINGHEIKTTPDKTILQVVQENKLDTIPTLCHDNRLEHFTSCFICVVEIEGMNKLIPSCSTKISNGMKIHTKSKTVFDTRKTGLELIMSNHYADCIGPCKNNCPAGVDAQAYISLISMGKYKEALRVVKDNNPLPLSIGRVCVRDCEVACRRNYVDEAVAVNAMKRFVADFDAEDKWVPNLKEKKNKKVAVIGGGPAGLTCAYFLTLEGYSVTIFEKLPKLGGMLRYGIPEYRLPKKVLNSEINWILDLGVEAKTNVELGHDFSIKDLMRSGYESVFISVGAHRASKLGLDGENEIKGIYRGIDFLRELMLNKIPELKGTVVVVGGGNTAIDAARTAIRCGADKVKIVYRRSIKEMPAHHEEIEAAITEGVEILILTNPKSLVHENGQLKGIECLKMVLEEGKPGERPKPVPQVGSEFIVECDFLISAIGQNIDTDFTKFDNDFMLEKWGTAIVNKDTLETTIPGVFAGGDVVTGALTAITSISQGKKAAYAIMGYIESGEAKKPEHKFYSLKHKLSTISDREFEHIKKLAREKMEELALVDRVHTFKEVEHTFHADQCDAEVGRCLECGCSEYFDCSLRKYCDEYNVDVKDLVGEVKKYVADGRHPFIMLDPNKCINCGKCVRTCSEILKVSALGFVYRGFKSIVKPAMEKPLLETNCIACGNCIDVCPTGAIAEKYPFKILGTMEKKDFETVCNFCSVGCKVNFKKIDNDIFYVSNSTEEIQETHNKGYLCTKGRFGHRYLYEKNRIFDPVVKRNGITQNMKTDDALHFVEKKVKSIIADYGENSVAVFASPKLSNEELYLLQKFARVGLKNNNIASFSNLFYGIEQNSLDDVFGFTSSTMSMNDLQNADAIVVINSNLSEENLVMELKIKSAQKNGAKLVLINSSEIQLTKQADLWIDSKKGSNTIVINKIIRNLIDRGLIDQKFVQERIKNFTDFNEALSIDDEMLKYASVDDSKLDLLTSLIGSLDKNVAVIYNIDSTSDKSVNDLKALANLLLVTGRHGKQNNGIIMLREFNNAVGVQEMGVTTEYLPGYVKFNDKEDIGRISKRWNNDLTNIFKPVDLATKMKRGEIKAAIIFGEDPYINNNSYKYFDNVEFLVVFDSYHTATSEKADVTIPIATFAEHEGSYTRCDNTVQTGSKIVDGVNEIDNWQLISKLASMFCNQFTNKDVKQLKEEIKLVNGLQKYLVNESSWLKGYFGNGFKGQKFNLANCQVDLSTFDPVKQPIHYQENYYLNKVKKMLV